MSAVLEFRKDTLGEGHYASRNHNDFRHTYDAQGGAPRAQVDWNLTLRQVGKKRLAKDGGSASLPNLSEAREVKRDPLVAEHHDGPYRGHNDTVGKYQNFAETQHMCRGLVRVSSGGAAEIDFQLNLRSGQHTKVDDKWPVEPGHWRRYFTRPQQSFDMMKDNCSLLNEAYKTSGITPQDRRIDRRSGALPIEQIRADPMSFRRNAGCEGSQVGLWEHLITDRRHGHKARRQLAHETTMRLGNPKDPSGGKITDNRTDSCIVEMLGKKKWSGGVSHEPLAARPPVGDPKLHHLSRMRILPERDEEDRKRRMTKQPRTDDDIPEGHQAKSFTSQH